MKKQLLLLIVAGVSVFKAQAATYTWTNGTTGGVGWSDAANWDSNGVPVEASDTTIRFFSGTSGAASTVTASFNSVDDAGTAPFDLQTLILNGTAVSAPQVSKTITIGPTGAGNAFNFTGTANAITFNSVSNLTYTISNNIAFVNGLTLNGSSTTSNTSTFFYNRISGAISGTGGFTKSGTSTVDLNGAMSFSGGLTLNGGRINLNTGNTYTGGTTITTGTAVLMSNTSFSSGTVTMNGGLIAPSGSGGRTLANNFTIGGNVSIIDGINIQNNTIIFNGTFDLSGLSPVLTIDNNAAATSAVTTNSATFNGVISNGGLLKSGRGRMILANSANTYTGDTAVRQGSLYVGANAASGANGALGNSTTAVQLGDAGTVAANTLVMMINGAFTVGRDINVNNYNSTGTTTVGGLNTTGTSTYSGNITLGSSSAAHGVSLSAAVGGTTEFTGVIQDTAGITGTGGLVTVLSGGKVSLKGANTYTGGTSVAGTLLVNNLSGSGTGTGAVSVESGGTLGGSGTISGAVTVNSGGSLSPGNSPGVLTMGSLDLNTGSSSVFELSGLTRGTQYDGVNVTAGGAIDFDGNLSLAFTNVSAFANASVFDLFNFTTTSTGDFTGLTSTGFYAGTWSKAGEIWSLTSGGQLLSFDEGSGDLTFSAVPEPSTHALFGLGMGVLWFLHRKKIRV